MARTAVDSQLDPQGNLGDLTTNSAGTKVTFLKHNRAGVAAPTGGDDATAGYAKGSIWIYGSTVYLCTDPTATAATWIDLTTGPIGPQGIQGIQGIQGFPGPTGATGPRGRDATEWLGWAHR